MATILKDRLNESQSRSKITKVRKRDGRIVDYDRNKIAQAIWKAAKAVGSEDKINAEDLAKKVEEILESKYSNGGIPSVEEIQDIVERVLVESGDARVAKAYILYREKRAEIRRAKALLGVEDDLKLPLNSIIILAARYLRRDVNRHIIETPRQLFRRVARAIALPDELYGGDVSKTEEEFYEMMV
ncbi:MAG: ATP cone domain-containing protein, partial [Nitrososphaerales archaeon]